MIITGDESIIEQLQNNSNVSLMKSVIFEAKDNEDELSDLIVREELFLYKQNFLFEISSMTMQTNCQVRKE